MLGLIGEVGLQRDHRVATRISAYAQKRRDRAHRARGRSRRAAARRAPSAASRPRTARASRRWSPCCRRRRRGSRTRASTPGTPCGCARAARRRFRLRCTRECRCTAPKASEGRLPGVARRKLETCSAPSHPSSYPAQRLTLVSRYSALSGRRVLPSFRRDVAGLGARSFE